jgi:hypothetical protein
MSLLELKNTLLPILHQASLTWSPLVEENYFPKVYPFLLGQTHFYMQHSVPLMKHAIRHESTVFEYLNRHIEEEKGHETWLLNDLEVLGYNRNFVKSLFVLPSVARMVMSQYEANHTSPDSILGYIFVLESTDLSDFKSVVTRSSIPLEAATCFLRHEQEDKKHREELDTLIDSLPISGIISSAVCTARCLVEFGKELGR